MTFQLLVLRHLLYVLPSCKERRVWLIKEFGEEYIIYMKKTKMFIPFVA